MDLNGVTQLLGGVNNQQGNNNNVNNNQPAIPGAPPAPPAQPQTLPGSIDSNFGEAGVFEPSGQTPQPGNVQQMWNAHQQQVDSFRRMIETLLNRQAEQQGLANGTWFPGQVEVTPEMRAEASDMIGEGGYFSVEETAARLISFAVAISGGDERMIDRLEQAVEMGFVQAERMFGGELPQISHDTLAAVREGFQQWREGGVGNIALMNR